MDNQKLIEGRSPLVYDLGLRGGKLVVLVHEQFAKLVAETIAEDEHWLHGRKYRFDELMFWAPKLDEGIMKAVIINPQPKSLMLDSCGLVTRANSFSMVISHMLAAIFSTLNLNSDDQGIKVLDHGPKQLFDLWTRPADTPHSAFRVSGRFSQPLADWLIGLSAQRLEKGERAVNRMMGKLLFPGPVPQEDRMFVRGMQIEEILIGGTKLFRISAGKLSGSSLAPSCQTSNYLDPGNLHNPIDQLNVLAGLAVITDLYRQGGTS